LFSKYGIFHVFKALFITCGVKMGNFAPSRRDKELWVEKLFLRVELADKLDSGKDIGLEDFTALFWHMGTAKLNKYACLFLRELIRCRREGIPYTQDNWAGFKQVCKGGNSRNIILKKLLHLGVIEKKNETT
jgi:hypothetical protein